MRNLVVLSLLITGLVGCTGVDSDSSFNHMDREDQRRLRNGSLLGGHDTSGYTIYSSRNNAEK